MGLQFKQNIKATGPLVVSQYEGTHLIFTSVRFNSSKIERARIVSTNHGWAARGIDIAKQRR